MASTLTLVRHGESRANAEDRFTGWSDVALNDAGRLQMAAVGRKITGLDFSQALCSDLKRAIESAEIILAGRAIPLSRHFALRGRNDGNLVGLNKTETAKAYGDSLAPQWRRDFHLKLPGGESLDDVLDRISAFWESEILPLVRRRENLLIVTHGNTIRALFVLWRPVPSETSGLVSIKNGDIFTVPFDTNGTIPTGFTLPAPCASPL